MKIQPLPLDNCFRRCCSCEAYNRVGKYLFSPFRSYHREGKDDHSSNTEDVQVMTVGQVILLFTRSHKTTSLHFGRAMQELYFSLSYECYKIANICNKSGSEKTHPTRSQTTVPSVKGKSSPSKWSKKYKKYVYIYILEN